MRISDWSSDVCSSDLPESVEEHVRVLSQPGALVAAIDWYRAVSGASSAATPAASVPTLYVWSDQAPALGRAAAEATAGQVSGPYRFAVLGGVGHWLPALHPPPLNPLLPAPPTP